MILTDKAKKDFLKWTKQGNLVNIMADVYLHALIIEWFDSVGIYVNIEYYNVDGDNVFIYSINNATYIEIYDTRQEATIQAILKANQIYNESKN